MCNLSLSMLRAFMKTMIKTSPKLALAKSLILRVKRKSPKSVTCDQIVTEMIPKHLISNFIALTLHTPLPGESISYKRGTMYFNLSTFWSFTYPVFAKLVQYVMTTALSITSFLEKLQGKRSVAPTMGIPNT